jgi:hypothetical protein
MLSLPFRRLPVRILRLLLLLLIGVELLLGLSLYRVTRTTASSTHVPVAVHAQRVVASKSTALPALPVVQNKPRTVVAGNKELFSVKLPKLSNAFVTYTITYPNEASMTKVMKTDGTGFSKVVFPINYMPVKYREPVVISVYYKGIEEAATRFAVQQPPKHR